MQGGQQVSLLILSVLTIL